MQADRQKAYNLGRQQVNRQTRQTASKHGETWTQQDLDYLAQNFVLAEAAVTAAALGRTVEACTQMFYARPERRPADRQQEQHTTARKTPGQRRWDEGFTSLDGLDREVDFSKLGW